MTLRTPINKLSVLGLAAAIAAVESTRPLWCLQLGKRCERGCSARCALLTNAPGEIRNSTQEDGQ